MFNIQQIHDDPELGDQEHHAYILLTNYLEKNGFKLTHKAAGLETAFMAEFSNSHSGRRVGFCCEYDALPGYKIILKEIHVSELI